MLLYSKSEGLLRRDDNHSLDPWSWTWTPAATPVPDDAKEISSAGAVFELHRPGRCRLVPVAVIGPREASSECLATATEMGEALGALGVPLLCGGKSGVMEAAAKGAMGAGGLTIGLLPDDHWTAANDYINLPLATGIGVARNALIARSALALIAIGGQYGTTTEAAFGLHFDKPVFGLNDAPDIPGVQHRDCVADVVDALLPILLRLSDLL